MVSRSYMAPDGRPPSSLETSFNQTILPALIDAAGGLEAVLERLAIRTRERPAFVLATAFGIGAVLSALLLPRR